MKFVKRCFIIIIMLILIILFVTTINKTTNATTNSNMIIVTGKVTDENNKNIANVEVSFIDTSTNTSSGNATTDSNGEYIVNIPGGKYKVEFKYPNNYDTKKIDIREYELYDKNFELGVVYNSELEDKKIKYLDTKFTKDSCDFRLIKNVYSKDEDLEQQIKNLQLNSESEHAFHDLIYEGHKGVTIILSDKQEAEIQKYIDDYLNGDYNSIICKPQESMSTILDKIYAKLEKNPIDEGVDTIESKNDNSATSKEVDLSSPTVIDAIIKRTELPPSTPQPPTPTPTPNPNMTQFIKGEIQKNGNIYTDVDGSVELLEYEVDEETGEGEWYSRGIIDFSTSNGTYSFGYLGAGKYKLSFEFKHTNEFNPQYYELDAAQDISEGITITNCLNKTNTNLSTIKSEISSLYQDMDYTKEKNLDDYTSHQIISSIKGETNEFRISDIDDQEELDNKKIVANVNFVERNKFSLTVEKNVSRYKIVLNNGQIFKQYTFDDSNSEHQHYRDLRLFNISMDTKLSYGAKLFVEYEIIVSNNSNIDCTGYTLLSTFENLEYDENQYVLIDSKKKNKDYGWEDKTHNLSEVNNLIDIDYTADSNVMTYLTLSGECKKNRKNTHYVTLTRPLDAENDDTLYIGTTELVKYSNKDGRRNYSKTDKTGNPMDNVIKVGNYTSGVDEADTYESEQIAVLPPTGFDIKTMCLLIISTTVCLFGFKYLVSNKLYINVKKSKLRKKWNKF